MTPDRALEHLESLCARTPHRPNERRFHGKPCAQWIVLNIREDELEAIREATRLLRLQQGGIEIPAFLRRGND